MSITVIRLAPVLAMAALLAGCAGGMGPDTYGGRPGATAEQARLRLTDQCVYEVSKTANALKDRITPRCQCYARGALKQMSPGEIASVAGGGSVPFSVRTQEIMNACAGRANAFADPPSRPRVKTKRPAEAPPDQPPDSSGEPAARPPSPPAGGDDQPKSQ